MQFIFENLTKLRSAMPLDKWQSASNNILLHTRGKGMRELLSKFRPNEPEDVQKYRLENSYLYTRDSFIKAIDAVKKSIISVGLTYDVQEELNFILENKRIKTPLGSFTIEQFLISIFQEVAEYPNAQLVWLPVNPNKNYDYIPFNHPKGLSETPTIKVDFEPFLATNIIYFDNENLVWQHGLWEYNSGKETKSAPYYMGVDLNGYYRSIPTSENKGVVQYTFEEYYTPNGGFSERHSRVLGGDLSSVTQNGVELKYYESYFANAAEFGRDFLSSYSDAKGVHIKNSFPIRVFNDSV
ncbi:MAG: hypothetical protein WD512_07660, partial [Candidatus Paceibacterota bacterium]